MVRSTSQSGLAQHASFLRVGRFDVMRFTVSDVDTLLREGIVPEDASTELLNGLIVRKDRAAFGGDPSMIGLEHRDCVERLSDLRMRVNTTARHVVSQQPLECDPDYLPEPDFAILKGVLGDYRKRYPTGAEALVVIEVADSSYERDIGEKLVAYAKAGVPQYVVINLRNRTAEVYESPNVEAGTYPPPTIIAEAGEVALKAGDGEPFSLRLADVLP